MPRHTLLILLALVLALPACIDKRELDRAGKKAEETPSVRDLPPMEVGAIELYRAYQQSRKEGPRHHAFKVYRNRAIEVSGRVTRNTHLLGAVEIALDAGGDNTEVVCTADTKHRDAISELDTGQSVTLLCTGNGWLEGPLLRDCKIKGA